jgi:hypothetical protein
MKIPGSTIRLECNSLLTDQAWRLVMDIAPLFQGRIPEAEFTMLCLKLRDRCEQGLIEYHIAANRFWWRIGHPRRN